MSALKRSEFEAMFEGRHQPGTNFTITGTDAARLKVTIEDGFEPDTCDMCGRDLAFKQCLGCDKYTCSACAVDDGDPWICRYCSVGVSS